MKFKELKKIAESNGYVVFTSEFRTTLRSTERHENLIEIDETSIDTAYFETSYSDFDHLEVIEACVEYAKTPLNERKEEKRYIIPLPHLVTTDGEQQYLTHNGSFFASRRDKGLRQTWKEEHLKYIPEEYRKYAVEVKE